MDGRSGLFTFFLFLFLAVMILLQILSMVQSDRLYERLNQLIDTLKSTTALESHKNATTIPVTLDALKRIFLNVRKI